MLPPGASRPPGFTTTNAEFSDQINSMALQFLYLSLGAAVAGYLQQV